jgi:hypothetical protein
MIASNQRNPLGRSRQLLRRENTLIRASFINRDHTDEHNETESYSSQEGITWVFPSSLRPWRKRRNAWYRPCVAFHVCVAEVPLLDYFYYLNELWLPGLLKCHAKLVSEHLDSQRQQDGWQGWPIAGPRDGAIREANSPFKVFGSREQILVLTKCLHFIRYKTVRHFFIL